MCRSGTAKHIMGLVFYDNMIQLYEQNHEAASQEFCSYQSLEKVILMLRYFMNKYMYCPFLCHYYESNYIKARIYKGRNTCIMHIKCCILFEYMNECQSECYSL